MKSAIIGLGVIGKVHYDVLKSQDADIVALCDVDESVLDKFDGVKKYSDYKKMLDCEDIDVVHICTPHYLHVDMAWRVLAKQIQQFKPFREAVA